jgi:hypothetical protein
MTFIPGLELSRMLYEEQIEPLLAERFPGLPYAAASLGMCSEILGLDDEVSMDHMWGPRVTIFVSPEDHERCSQELMATFRAELPMTFKGFDMAWLQPGVDVQDTRERILYSVRTTTLSNALRFCGGADALPLKDVDWLTISEQHLLEFTNGVVYRDDTGELTGTREALAYYPDNVLRFLLMCGWNAVGGDWFLIGRIGTRGDRLGLRIQAAQAAQHLMRLGFMVSRTYYTYKKWFGSLFARLPIADELEPILLDLLREERWQQVEERLWDAAAIVLRHQNALGIAPEIPIEVQRADDGRHHLACDYWEIGRKTAGELSPGLKALQDNELFWLHEKQLILWNQEVGKWVLFLQKDDATA